MVGPPSFLPDSLFLMVIGLIVGGPAFPNQYNPCLPEMVENTQNRFPGQELKTNSMSAGFFNSMISVGYLIAPIYGSAVN